MRGRVLTLGEKLGLLTYRGLSAEWNPSGARYSRWDCDCGAKDCLIIASDVGRKTLSCGCHRNDVTTRRNRERCPVKIGEKIGRLTYRGPSEERHPCGTLLSLWDCECGTSNIKVALGCVTTGNTTSCGCAHIDDMKRRRNLCGQYDNVVLLERTERRSRAGKIFYKALCQRCGTIFFPIGSNVKNMGSRCPKCNESKGEKRIVEVLEQQKGISILKYKRQAKFSTCKDKRALPFDFIVFVDGKDPGVIEYQGRQHYEPIRAFGGEASLLEVKKRDEIKRHFCLARKLSMLVISYKQFDQIENLVMTFVASLPAAWRNTATVRRQPP